MPSDLRAAAPADLDGAGPLWSQIRRALERPILAGVWRTGTVIPSEHELMARYGAARMTVNRAVRSLAEQGLVERRRKRGTVVAAAAPERPILEIWDIAAESERNGAAYRLELLDRAIVEAGEEDGFRPGLKPGAPILRLVTRHRSDGVVLQLEERAINLDAVPEAAEIDFGATAPGHWLLSEIPWTEAEHVIQAKPASRLVADRLEVARGTACLVIERQTWNGPTPITVARMWHPGETHRLRGKFEHGKG